MLERKSRKEKSKVTLAPIPEKLYFTIGEVGRLCQLKPHVLRYWEQEFPQLSPAKRRGNRRYYQRKDVILVRQIRKLLYEEGYTIEGARHQMHQPVQTEPLAPLSVSAMSTNLPELSKENMVVQLEKVVTLLEEAL